MKNILSKKEQKQVENAIKQAVIEALSESYTEIVIDESKNNEEYKEEIKQAYIASIKQAMKSDVLTRDDLAEIVFYGKPAAIVATLNDDYSAPVSLSYLSKAHMVALLTTTVKVAAKAMEIGEKKLLKDLEKFLKKVEAGEPDNEHRTTTTKYN